MCILTSYRTHTHTHTHPHTHTHTHPYTLTHTHTHTRTHAHPIQAGAYTTVCRTHTHTRAHTHPHTHPHTHTLTLTHTHPLTETNECKTDATLCPEDEGYTCMNTVGSYRCVCKKGYVSVKTQNSAYCQNMLAEDKS